MRLFLILICIFCMTLMLWDIDESLVRIADALEMAE